MKALTIKQPWAHLIVTPQSELPAGFFQKRVENRTWAPEYRGAILIHAGKSQVLIRGAEELEAEMAFGAIVGVVQLMSIYHISRIERGEIPYHLMWLNHHVHVEGPECWVLGSVRRLKQPVYCRGFQGLFDVPIEKLSKEFDESGRFIG